jgi:Polyketide cyclase / dehydrase and lipid transport
MRPVLVQRTFTASPADAERCWYACAGWPAWVDGLDRVLEVSRPWPRPGGVVVWESGPAGRGRVTERVVAFAPGDGQSVEVRDDSITGRQSVAFTPRPDGVSVALTLEYRLRRRSPVSAVIDALFIRRAMAQSLERTLARFGAQLPPAGGAVTGP